MTLSQRLAAAFTRRAPLAQSQDITAYRLINRAGDGFPDLAVDRYGEVLVAHLYDIEMPRALLTQLAAQTSARALYVKHRPAEASKLSAAERAGRAPAAPLIGQAVEQVVIRENGLQYLIRPGEGLSVGLFLDMREMRAWVREHAAGKTVLNCFAYTCGFGLAALAGGATRAVNVDVSRKYLDWGMDNARLNGFAPEVKDFIAGDVFDWLNRWRRKRQAFDMVILDPPAYSTTKTTRFAVERNYAELVALAAHITAPGGWLLACANAAELPLSAFKAKVRAGLAGFPARLIRVRHEPEIDFPSAEPYLKIGLIQMGQGDKVVR